MAEQIEVCARPRLQRFLNPELRDAVLSDLHAFGVYFVPSEGVADFRDPKDNLYLDLALESDADMIVSSDQDLLVLHPWRSVRILLPAEYLADDDASP